MSASVRMMLCVAATAASVAIASAAAGPGGAPGAVPPDSPLNFSAVARPRTPAGLTDTSSSRPVERAVHAQVSAALPATGCIEWSTLAEGLPLTNIGTNAVYDPVRERMLVFGGSGQTDVWGQSLTGLPHWTRLSAQGVPPPHGYYDRAIHDPVRDRMLLFRNGTSDVWELSLSGTPAWRLLSTTNAPYFRGEFTLAFDPVRDRAIVFGGFNADGDILTGTWALSLGDLAWSALPDGPAVYDPRAFYDPARDRLVVVAGYHPGAAYVLSLSGTPQWSGLTSTGTPPGPRDGIAATYDPVRDRVLVFGGLASGYLNDLWALGFVGGTAAVWAPITPANPPVGRNYANAIYDAPRDRMVLFGGRNHQDTWALPLTGSPGWSELDDPNRPPTPHGAHSAVWDRPRQRMVVFGGEGWDNPAMSDVRSLSLSGPPVWSSLAPAGQTPVGRADHSAIYDPVRERMIVFGGREGSNARLLADVWAFSLAGAPAWTPLAPGAVAPGKRSSHTAIYDPLRDRMIVFGGYDDALVYHNDTWAYDLGGGGWQRLDPAGTPPTPTVEHCAVYDPVRDRMLVIGGFDRVTGFLNTVWELSLAGAGSWTQLSPAGSPPPTRDAVADYDPSRNRVLLYGGTSYSPEVYALDLSGGPMWSVAATNTPQPPRDGHAAIFDADHDRWIVAGGVFKSWTGFGEYRNDVIAMTVPANASPLTVAVEPAGAGAVAVDPLQSCYVTGANVTLTATPATGHGFSGWGGDAAGSENPLTITMTGPRNVVARFTGYPVAMQAAPAAGGSVTRDPDQPTYAPGSTVTITAMPAVGYAFSGWSGDAQGLANPLVLTVDGPKAITANFLGHAVTVTTLPPDAGTVVRIPEQATYAPGTSLMLTARPKAGYGFVGWSGDANGPFNPTTLVVNGPKSVSASFEAIPATCGGWSAVGPGGPGRRWLAVTVWDPARERLIVFGGYGDGRFLNDTWAFMPATSTWIQLAPRGTPPSPRDGVAAAYDPVRRAVVLVGGNNGTLLNDAYFLALEGVGTPAWSVFPTAGIPPAPRFAASLVYDPPGGRFLLFGGYTGVSEPHPLWELGFTDGPGTWRPIDLANSPPYRFGQAAFYDPVRDRMLIFGGSRAALGPDLNDLWALDLAGPPAWQELLPAGGSPPERSVPVAAYDAARDRMIVFGGQRAGVVADDTWALSLSHGPAWVNLTPYSGAAPEARSSAGGAFDPSRGQLLLFGGYSPSAANGLGDTWRLGLAQGQALDLALEAPGQGAVLRTPNQGCYPPGATVTLTPIAAPGNRFAGWSGDASGSASPLALTMGGYGSIVARFEPVTTATLLAQFDALSLEQGIVLRWRFGTPERVLAVVIERAGSGDGPWAVLPLEQREEAGAFVAVDETAEAGREYFYRLVATLRDGPNTTFGPVTARPAGAIIESAITLVAPNPCAGGTQIQFAVARAGHVRMVVADVAGRIVTTLLDGNPKPGRYSVAWDGTAASRRAPPGLYFLRLTAPDRTSVARLAIIR